MNLYFIQTHEDEETEYDVEILMEICDLIYSIDIICYHVGVVS